jgi:hypothetical protein
MVAASPPDRLSIWLGKKSQSCCENPMVLLGEEALACASFVDRDRIHPEVEIPTLCSYNQIEGISF